MEINKENYKQILLRHFEHELTHEEQAEVEAYIHTHEEAAGEWDLLQLTRLKPDADLYFPNKNLLFRSEIVVPELTKTVVITRYYRYAVVAVAAAVLGFIILFNLRHAENTATQALVRQPAVQDSALNHNSSQYTKNGPSENQKLMHIKAVVPIQAHQLATCDSNIKKAPDNETQNNKDMKDNQSAPGPKGAKEPDIDIDHEKANLINHVAQAPISDSGSDVTPRKSIARFASHAVHPVAADQEEPTTVGSLLGFVHNISLKKKTRNNQTYYALSIETPEIKINKTFKSLTER